MAWRGLGQDRPLINRIVFFPADRLACEHAYSEKFNIRFRDGLPPGEIFSRLADAKVPVEEYPVKHTSGVKAPLLFATPAEIKRMHEVGRKPPNTIKGLVAGICWPRRQHLVVSPGLSQHLLRQLEAPLVALRVATCGFGIVAELPSRFVCPYPDELRVCRLRDLHNGPHPQSVCEL